MRVSRGSRVALLALYLLSFFLGTLGQKDGEDEKGDDWCEKNCGENMTEKTAAEGWCAYCGGDKNSTDNNSADKESGDKDSTDSKKDYADNVEGQTTGSLSWAGSTRQYTMIEPSSTPTGLIIVLVPVGPEIVAATCSSMVGLLPQNTGALVVCPAAGLGEARSGSNELAEKGGGAGPCWKAFANFGYCFNGRPEGTDDVDFLAALIQHIKGQHVIPAGRTVVSGFSNGASMAYRFHCEKSELMDALVTWGQAWFDPYVGYFDYDKMMVPPGMARCNPACRRPLYSAIGTADNLYGQQPAHAGFGAVENWHNYSTQVLGCEGESTAESETTSFLSSEATCYQYPACQGITTPGVNKMCSVPGIGHDGAGLAVLITMAFGELMSSKALDNATVCAASTVDSAFSTATSFGSLLAIAVGAFLQRAPPHE